MHLDLTLFFSVHIYYDGAMMGGKAQNPARLLFCIKKHTHVRAGCVFRAASSGFSFNVYNAMMVVRVEERNERERTCLYSF